MYDCKKNCCCIMVLCFLCCSASILNLVSRLLLEYKRIDLHEIVPHGVIQYLYNKLSSNESFFSKLYDKVPYH